ncbi:hypothetical protein L1987_51302 [Smallanthus sonchifolius]|uniref:Uncharacterized protein n=1 Tax=Smallanthus sonchifolius TaxID=185202 RepID=A0ACB9EQ80_9ASTR|nr:hypothetical protein L1987_51302 [Smallanthus sonchifolius]
MELSMVSVSETQSLSSDNKVVFLLSHIPIICNLHVVLNFNADSYQPNAAERGNSGEETLPGRRLKENKRERRTVRQMHHLYEKLRFNWREIKPVVKASSKQRPAKNHNRIEETRAT